MLRLMAEHGDRSMRFVQLLSLRIRSVERYGTLPILNFPTATGERGTLGTCSRSL